MHVEPTNGPCRALRTLRHEFCPSWAARLEMTAASVSHFDVKVGRPKPALLSVTCQHTGVATARPPPPDCNTPLQVEDVLPPLATVLSSLNGVRMVWGSFPVLF